MTDLHGHLTTGGLNGWFRIFDPITTFLGVRTVLSTSLKGKVKDYLTRYIQNNIALNSFNINEKTAPFFIKIFLNKALLIKGYLSSYLTSVNLLKIIIGSLAN